MRWGRCDARAWTMFRLLVMTSVVRLCPSFHVRPFCVADLAGDATGNSETGDGGDKTGENGEAKDGGEGKKWRSSCLGVVDF